ncbi:uncharacterized protein LOC121708943 isoform X1 [Alosa sapidissima]|uniref:uncharacterized protein LOC121708943 isoform X1 n=1 Tax=Alosa sapidissima TaxID=34773 RepID=UPI001C085BF2|nr:uncharacterized protein LOC121708943 isoform X1 [Alosa sapidissima]
MWICWEVIYFMLFFCGEFCSSENQKWISHVGLQGRSFMFPVQISQFGNVKIEGGDNIAIVFKSEFRIEDQLFTNHMCWDHETGNFFLHNLSTDDSGKYVIEDTVDQNMRKKYYFQLTVYEEVSQPQVSQDDESSCMWRCSVENGKNMTLAWYKDNVCLNQTGNPDNNISLSLPLEIEDSSTYDCVAANPAINQTTHLSHSDTQHCLKSTDAGREHGIIISVVVLSVIGVILVGGVFLSLRKRRNEYIQAQSANEEPQTEVQYSEILHSDIRLRQGHGPHIPELDTEGEEPPLTSIYTKIQPHSPEATGTDSNVMGSGSTVLGRL